MYRLPKILVPAVLAVSATIALPAATAAQRSGVEIWAQSCGRCHRPQPANRYTADAWETIMAQMRIYARLTDDEASAVLQFLQSGAKPIALDESGTDPTVVAETNVGSIDGANRQARATALRAQQDAVERYMTALMSRRHP